MGEIDRCLLVSLPGQQVDEELADWLRGGLGGVILFARNVGTPGELRRLTDQLREVRADVIVAVDEEGGDVTRLEAATGSSWPGNLALGRVDEPAATRRCAAGIAAELARAGVTLDLAPVADVNTNADNPVIGTRSFGADPALVSRHVAAVVEGLQAGGVAACAKHFPGHGATSVDSHLALPYDRSSREELTAVHLPPFVAAIEAGVASVMTAHVIYPALAEAPATIAPEILTDLLRSELGFTGVVVSDALGMAAIAGTVGTVAGAVASLDAGVDLVCLDGPRALQREARAACHEAVSASRLTAGRVRAAAERVEALARSFPAQPATEAGPAATLGLELARRALVVDAPGLPLASAPYVIDTTSGGGGEGRVIGRLRTALAALGVDAPGVDTTDPGRAGAAALAAPADRPLVLVVRDAHRHPALARLVEDVLGHRSDAVLVSIGVPADTGLAPGRYLGTLSAAPPSMAAAAERLCGQRR